MLMQGKLSPLTQMPGRHSLSSMAQCFDGGSVNV